MLRPSLIMLLVRSGIMRLVFKLMMDGRVPLRLKAILPATLVYLIMPFDFIPDIVPVLGWLDDILAIVISLTLFLALAPKDVVLEHVRGGRGGGGAEPKREGKVVDGDYRVIDDESPNKQ